MNTESILSIENLHVQIGKRMVLQDVSLKIKPGEIVGIIGPNGCGKTTLLNAISGFLPIDTGTVSVNGQDIMSMDPYERAKLGIVRGFQHAGVFRDLTLEENLMMVIETAQKYPWWWMFSSKLKKRMKEIIDHSLSEVGLLDHKLSPAGVLSGGQLRLLELARIELAKGNLLLIDEPTAGVAPALKNTLQATIKRISKNHNHAIVIVEHDLKFLFDIAERIIVLVEGQKYLEGTPAEVRADESLKKIYFGD